LPVDNTKIGGIKIKSGYFSWLSEDAKFRDNQFRTLKFSKKIKNMISETQNPLLSFSAK